MQAKSHLIQHGRARTIFQMGARLNSAMGALVMLCLAVLSARAVFLYASVCTSPILAERETILAVGILLTGAIFNWASFDMLLAELLPLSMGAPITISALLSIVLMAGTLRTISLASHHSRLNQSGSGWTLVAGALVWMYATFSAFGFCVISGIWFA